MRHFLENFNFSVDSYHEIFNRTKFLKNKFKNHELHKKVMQFYEIMQSVGKTFK